MLVIHSLVKTPLFLGVDTVARQTDGQPAFGPTYRSGHELTWALRMFLVGAVVLVSGFWGQSTIESSVWESASQLAGDTWPQQNAASAPLMGLEAQTWFLILSWAATLSLMLSAFAFVRALMLTFSQASHNAEHLTTPSTDGWPPGAMLAIGLRR